MTEVTYYVALPFVLADGGIAASEPTEYFNPVAVVMRAEALSCKEGTSAPSRSTARVTLLQANLATPP
jgi:hypothetical protein